ncbi:MAG: hypothetical protein H0V29_04795 [Thermoleophilaceae bacterium]|nr:hypothetical protein [Thermoleophilaceae bacterium]
MLERFKFPIYLLIVALIALVFTVAPGGGNALNTILTALMIAFFTAIAFLGVRMFRDYRFNLDTLEDRERFVLYAALAGVVLTFTATNRLFASGGVGVLLWICLLALCAFGLFWVYGQTRRYN